MESTAVIKVFVPTPLREHSRGARELTLTATNLRDVLVELEREYPALHRHICDDTGALRKHINLFVNKTHMRECAGLDTRLAVGDVVTIMTAVSGG